MARLKNHGPAYWLNPSAAAAWDRMEADHGFIDITEAGRSEATQQGYIDRWNRGDRAGLYKPAMPASASNHVRNGGAAVDTNEYERIRKFSINYGWKWFGYSDPVHFDYVGPTNSSTPSGNASGFSQRIQNEQAWLISQGYNLGPSGADGIKGGSDSYTTNAYKKYQEFLRKYGYTGPIDGDWAGGTQTAHQKFYDEKHAVPNNGGGTAATVNDLGKLQRVIGLQKVAKLYGYAGGLDNDWGNGSKGGLQNFLNQNYRGSLASWLRTKWGYGDNDDIWGPNMKAAAQRAEAGNDKAL